MSGFEGFPPGALHFLDVSLETSVPPEAHTREFPAFCASRYRALVPLVDWLAELMQG